MTLVAVASAKGSPGVSVTVAGLATVWGSPVVIADCDPIGGDVALRYRDPEGDPLDPNRGLLSLGAAVRAGQRATLDDHLQLTRSGVRALVGVTSPEQVNGLGPAWQHIAGTLRRAPGVTVLADVGRVMPGSPAMPLLEQADAVVMITGTTLEDVAHLRERLRGLKALLRLGSIDAIPVGVAMVTRASDSRGVEDVDRLLASAGLPVRPLGVIARDPKAADALRTDSGRNISRSDLLRSLRDLARSTRDLAELTGRVRDPAS